VNNREGLPPRYSDLLLNKKKRREYLKFVMREARKSKLEIENSGFIQNPSDSWWSYRSNLWSHVVFIIQQL
jgi:hypothetical protein